MAPDPVGTEPADPAGSDASGGTEKPEGIDPAAPREDDLERRLRQVSSAFVALQQEMQSFRERADRLQEERDRRRRGEIVIAMFEPVRNLHRSLEAWRRHDLPDEAVQGLTLVLAQFQDALSRLGLEEIHAAPVPFDPTIHDAICAIPVQHAALDGHVVQVFEAGYRVGGQIIQPARVIIGRYEEPPAAPDPDTGDQGTGESGSGADPA